MTSDIDPAQVENIYFWGQTIFLKYFRNILEGKGIQEGHQ